MPRLDGEEDQDETWLRALFGPEGQSRRGRALTAAAALEELLETLINATLERYPARMNSLGAPPSGKEQLSRKIANARSIGAINDREALECDVIRLVRNKFAHDPDASFYRGVDLIEIVSQLGDPPHPNLAKRNGVRLDAAGADIAHFFTVMTLLRTIKRRTDGRETGVQSTPAPPEHF